MANGIQTRFESKGYYEAAQRTKAISDYEAVTGYLSLRKSKSPLSTIELDEDSIWLVYSDWTSFVQHALGGYASRNADRVATVYTYRTGRSPSTNYSHGEGHERHGWHNAVFFGVVGRGEVLEAIRLGLVGGAGVPDDVVNSYTGDVNKRPQIYCDHSPDSILFDSNTGKASFHVEDGLVWSPQDPFTWYTDSDWRPKQ